MLTCKKQSLSLRNGIVCGALSLTFSLLTILLRFSKTTVYLFECQRKKSHYDDSFLSSASVMWVIDSVTCDAPSIWSSLLKMKKIHFSWAFSENFPPNVRLEYINFKSTTTKVKDTFNTDHPQEVWILFKSRLGILTYYF